MGYHSTKGSTMTRKHFEAVAREIRLSTKGHTDDALHDKILDKRELVEHLSAFFVDDNPNFDKQRFFNACYAD